MHAGLNTPDNRLDEGGREAQRVAQEIAAVLDADADANGAVRAPVALVFDYEAKWLFEVQPQGADFHYPRFAFEYYSALRSLGLDVDIVSAHAPLDGYRLVVVPPLPIVPDDFASRLAASGAHAVFGPRTGSKTADLQIPPALPPGPLASILPVRVWRVESLRPNATERIDGTLRDGAAFTGDARHWRDLVELNGDDARNVVRARFADGHPACVSHGTLHYWAALFDDATTVRLFADVAAEAGLAPAPLGDGVRVSRRGGLTYVFNYGDAPHAIDAVPPSAFVLGTAQVGPQDVAVYRSRS